MATNIEEVKVGGATEVESSPAAAPVSKPKKERTPSQIAQFEAARKKAYEMRSQAKEALKNQKAAAAQEEAEVEAVETSEEEAPPPPKPKPRKVKKRKVVVVEAEESSDTEEEMEIRLPPKKEKPAPPPPPDPYAAHYSRMFSL